MMNSIIDNQREILLSVQGTNIWSGQQPQQYNSQAIAWGGLSHELFSAGQRYQWVPWAYVVGLFVPIPFWVIHRYWPKLRADYLYTPVIVYVLGYFETRLLTARSHFTVTTSDGFVSGLTRLFSPTSQSHSSHNGGCARATLAGLPNTTTLSELVSILNYLDVSGSHRMIKPFPEALKLWCLSSRLRCKVLVGTLIFSLHGGARTKGAITTIVPC
jgi:hypothetical protein